jgi:hypothetical protein
METVEGEGASSLPAWSSVYTMDRLSRALRKDPVGMHRIGYARHVNAAVQLNNVPIQPKKVEGRCAYAKCAKKSIKLRVCARCECTQYCSRDCQAADWKQHKKVCLPLNKQQPKA